MPGKQKKVVIANARRQVSFASRMQKSGRKRVAFWVTPKEEIMLRDLMNGRKEAETERYDLHKLVGSEKQIRWANDIRLKRLRELSEMLGQRDLGRFVERPIQWDLTLPWSNDLLTSPRFRTPGSRKITKRWNRTMSARTW